MVAQVNDTRARVRLAEKRFAEAERAIFAAVTVLEQLTAAIILLFALPQPISFRQTYNCLHNHILHSAVFDMMNRILFRRSFPRKSSHSQCRWRD